MTGPASVTAAGTRVLCDAMLGRVTTYHWQGSHWDAVEDRLTV